MTDLTALQSELRAQGISSVLISRYTLVANYANSVFTYSLINGKVELVAVA